MADPVLILVIGQQNKIRARALKTRRRIITTIKTCVGNPPTILPIIGTYKIRFLTMTLTEAYCTTSTMALYHPDFLKRFSPTWYVTFMANAEFGIFLLHPKDKWTNLACLAYQKGGNCKLNIRVPERSPSLWSCLNRHLPWFPRLKRSSCNETFRK